MVRVTEAEEVGELCPIPFKSEVVGLEWITFMSILSKATRGVEDVEPG